MDNTCCEMRPCGGDLLHQDDCSVYLAIMADPNNAPVKDHSMTNEEIEIACEIMHDAYELAALKAGWETNELSKKPWSQVPEANKVTMRKAVIAVIPYIQGLVKDEN